MPVEVHLMAVEAANMPVGAMDHLEHSTKYPKSQSPVIGAGNGTPGPISGQIWQMSATHVHSSSIVVVSWPAGAIVSGIELDSDAAQYLKEIVGQVFEIYTIELLGSLPTDEA